MRTTFIIPLLLLAPLKGMAQSNDSILNKHLYRIETTLEDMADEFNLKNRYKLYQTENLYNLLKLDTATGMIWQVQWSLEDTNEATILLNGADLSFGDGPGTFELYPTKNMYQYILLDQVTGRTWHVQWGLEDKYRVIRRIY